MFFTKKQIILISLLKVHRGAFGPGHCYFECVKVYLAVLQCLFFLGGIVLIDSLIATGFLKPYTGVWDYLNNTHL